LLANTLHYSRFSREYAPRNLNTSCYGLVLWHMRLTSHCVNMCKSDSVNVNVLPSKCRSCCYLQLENCTRTESEPDPRLYPSISNPYPPDPWYSAHPRPSPQTQIANTLLKGCEKVVNAQNSAIITHKLYSLQTMQIQQSVDRFCRQHISSIFYGVH